MLVFVLRHTVKTDTMAPPCGGERPLWPTPTVNQCQSNMATRWGICSAGKISHDFTVALKSLPPGDHQVSVWVDVSTRNAPHVSEGVMSVRDIRMNWRRCCNLELRGDKYQFNVTSGRLNLMEADVCNMSSTLGFLCFDFYRKDVQNGHLFLFPTRFNTNIAVFCLCIMYCTVSIMYFYY